MRQTGGSGKFRFADLSGSGFPYLLVAVILALAASARIVSTYSVFTQTYDEPYHIGGGMEWLGAESPSQFEDPPLGQVAVALGLYLTGHRVPPIHPDQPMGTGAALIGRGNAVLESGNYWDNLRLARMGVLPFFFVACITVFLWGRRWFSRATGVWAVLLFTSLPPILGHASVATVDMAGTAAFTLALYVFLRWLETPRWRSSIALGIALGAAFLCKLSNLAFLAICFIPAIGYAAWVRRAGFRLAEQFRLRAVPVFVVACVALLSLWAGYRFSAAPLSKQVGVHPAVDRRFQSSPLLRDVAYKVLECPLPLREVATGVGKVMEHNKGGHDSYLLGEDRFRGWWYFFPVVLGVKTPIGFLVLAMAGLIAVLRRWNSHPWQQRLTAFFPILILLFCMTSHIDLGVRHILVLFPMLSLLAGHAVSLAFTQKNRIIPVMAVLLVGSVAVDSWEAHPDYLAWFNQIGGKHPEKILVESDLDWGQDLQRLSLRLRSLGADHVAIRYFGSAPLEKADLPPYSVPLPNEKATGYYAISVRFATMDSAKGAYGWLQGDKKGYGWLKGYKPLERIGKSIDLYYIKQD